MGKFVKGGLNRFIFLEALLEFKKNVDKYYPNSAGITKVLALDHLTSHQCPEILKFLYTMGIMVIFSPKYSSELNM